MADTTRSSLIRRVRDPDDSASWREFVALYEPLLLSYVRSRGLNDADSQDVAQEIFAKLLRLLPTFELDHSRGRFRTWLWQVTMTTLADWARRERRRGMAEAEWRERLGTVSDAASEQPDQEWLQAQRRRVLEFVLSQVQAETQPKTWACFDEHVLRSTVQDQLL